MNEQINREQVVHGTDWNSVHDGYFSDPAVARPFLEKIREVASDGLPDLIVDLGGGTGFLLAQLRAGGLDPRIALLNLEASPAQAAAAEAAGCACWRGSVEAFSRRELGLTDDRRGLFMMRSVLHYFGEQGLRPVLRRLRAQVRPEEFFVHQTASFQRLPDADCLNALYRMMGTTKWYPTVEHLCRLLREEGWEVREVSAAPPLRLRSEDLQRRYQLTRADLRRLCDHWAWRVEAPADVLHRSGDGFCAYLHYWIYVCSPRA